MINLILFIIVSYAVVNIYSKEYIFSPVRKILDFKPFNCPYCISTWIGFGLSFLFEPLYSPYYDWFLYGMIAYFSYKTLNKLLGDDLYIE